jgi:hypothetical protein
MNNLSTQFVVWKNGSLTIDYARPRLARLMSSRMNAGADCRALVNNVKKG